MIIIASRYLSDEDKTIESETLYLMEGLLSLIVFLDNSKAVVFES